MTPHESASQVLAPREGLIIVSCSREKLVTSGPVPAWDLYHGACVPQARAHFADQPALRARTRILSAAHGLLRPDTPISTYDQRITTHAQAHALHEETVADQLDAEFAASPAVRHLLIIAEPLYLLALRRVFDYLDGLASVTSVPDPWAWSEGLATLKQWGWA